MAYRRSIRYAAGETLLACGVCGFTYLYPSELVLGDDRTLRCTRTCHRDETEKGHNERRAAWRPPADNEAPAPVGRKPQWR